MSKVYLVCGVKAYEGFEILKNFSTIEFAESYAKIAKNDSSLFYDHVVVIENESETDMG